MVQKFILCIMLLSSFSITFGMQKERQSPDVEKLFFHLGFTNQSLQGMAIPPLRRASLPDRRHIALLALRDCYSPQLTSESTPIGAVRSVEATPIGTPNTNRSTPSGIDRGTPSGATLHNLLDAISIVTVEKEELEGGWQERKKNAFKSSLFSKSNTEDAEFSTTNIDSFKVCTIVYHVHIIKKQYKVVSFKVQKAALNDSVVADARLDAMEELRMHLTKEVEKEAEDNGWSLENSTKE